MSVILKNLLKYVVVTAVQLVETVTLTGGTAACQRACVYRRKRTSSEGNSGYFMTILFVDVSDYAKGE